MTPGPYDIVAKVFSIRYAWKRALLDQQARLLFVPIPKVASTSMQHFMLTKRGCHLDTHDFAGIKAAQKELLVLHNTAWNPGAALRLFRDCRVFSLVRNPIDRFLSAHQMINTRAEYKQAMEKKTGLTLKGENHVDRLLDYLGTKPVPDWHFLPQYWFIAKANLDFVVRLGAEDIGERFAEEGLGHWIEGFPNQVLNPSATAGFDLTPRQIHEIESLYSRDFEIFGGQTDLPSASITQTATDRRDTSKPIK